MLSGESNPICRFYRVVRSKFSRIPIMPSPTRFWSELDSSLRDRANAGLFRTRQTWEHLSPRLIADESGRQLVNFGSNDYLSLSWFQSAHSGLGRIENQVVKRGRASPLVTGSTREHEELAQETGEIRARRRVSTLFQWIRSQR